MAGSHPRGDATQRIIDLWKTAESSNSIYYEQAESEEWLRGFWREGSVFLRQFRRLDLTSVLELACGKGRHAAQIVHRCGHLTLFDTSVAAMDACRVRFASHRNVTFILSSCGRDLGPIPDSSLTAVYSYDSMVHFEMDCVFGYLAEIARVLRPGGMALLHHSIYDPAPGGDVMQNPGWRNSMSESAFRDTADRSGLRVESMETFNWATPIVTDALTLLVRPA